MATRAAEFVGPRRPTGRPRIYPRVDVQTLEWRAQAKQREFLRRTEHEVGYGGAAGGGKALVLSTPIPTPTGWTTMSAISPGDAVFDERGQVCTVVAISDVMVDHTVCDVVFSDGSIIRADVGHLWATTTDAERVKATRRTPEFRARRRANRQRRGTGKRPDLGARNSAAEHAYLPPPLPGVHSTAEIADTLLCGSRVNHAISVCGPLALPTAILPIDPYVLGVWLGDGTSASGVLTTADAEIVTAVAVAGYQPHKRSGPYDYGTRGLSPQLRGLGLLGDKRIPGQYLRASVEQRKALLCGLMDTDGYVDVRGKCEFTTTTWALADGICELLLSLGVQVVVTRGRAMLYGRDCGEKYRLIFRPSFPVFRLARKRLRQTFERRPTATRRYIVDVRQVPSEPVRCIAVDSPSHLYLAGRSMIPTHNSDALLLLNIIRRVNYPGSSGLYLRRTFADLARQGAAISRSQELLSGVARYNAQDHKWHFANGSVLEFGYLADDNDKYGYQSAAYEDIEFDEATQFTEDQYLYLFSRARTSRQDCKAIIRLATNPGNVGHAWFKRRFLDPMPPYVTYTDPVTQRTRAFIPARLADNEYLSRNDEYRHALLELPEAERRQLLDGDWDTFAGQAFGEFRRDVHTVPPFRIPDDWPRWVSVDSGWTHPFVALWWTRSRVDGRCYIYRELIASGVRDSEQARRILDLSGDERISLYYADPAMWGKRSQTGTSSADEYRAAGINLRPGQNDRVQGKRRVHDLLAVDPDSGRSGLQIFETCVGLIACLTTLVLDPHDVEDVLKTDGDDAYDALRYGAPQPLARAGLVSVGLGTPSSTVARPGESAIAHRLRQLADARALSARQQAALEAER